MATQSRPPIIAVLGHVDHGKTSLLDKIRNTQVAAREAGGITQSIGAWQTKTKEGRVLTFIDTPGHAAFNQMRSRGAKLADIAILVVAADDGLMPQTKESIQYLNEAKTPFVVAITKIDLPTALAESAKGSLAKEGVLLEGWGGDTPVVEVSSKTGKGIDDLLEVILLMADVQDIKADPEGEIEAVILETERDASRGPVVAGIVKNGTLKIGQDIGAEGIKARIRGLFDQDRKPVKEAPPGTPVEILGFADLPSVGSVVTSGHLQELIRSQSGSRGQIAKKREGFWIILKADTAGSLEAVRGALGEKIGIITSSVGDVAEADVVLAVSTGSTPIVCFNTRVSREIQKFADEEDIKIYNYKIIYELLEDVEKWQKELEEAQSEKILGKAQVLAQFPHEKETRIAGCKVVSGRITKSDKLRLIRDEKPLGNVRILSLKKNKSEADSANINEEFGIYFVPQLDFRIGDTLEAFLPPKAPAN